MHGFRKCLAFALFAVQLLAQGPANVVIVINDNSSLSREIGEYYARRRAIPQKNVCRIHTSTEETMERATYNTEIAAPIARCLAQNQLVESTLYVVTTMGVPLRIKRISGEATTTDGAAVDSELTLLPRYAEPQTTRDR